MYRENKNNVKDDNNCPEEKELIKDLSRIKNNFIENFQKIIFCDEPFYTGIVLIELYIFWSVSKLINDIIILLVIGNIIIFYSLIEIKYPQFLFRIRMSVKEIIEGVITAIMAIIPKYKEEIEAQ